MRAVDTNVLGRLITRDDPDQASSADNFVEKGAWAPVLALVEATWVLETVYELTTNDLIRTIEMLLNHRDLVLQDAETVTLALQRFRARPALGFIDCLIVESARKAGHLPLGTFDKNLSKVEGAQRL